jgi:mRNA-degrading endonuclease RelE of RelBE toxin-antitoxin system
MSESSRAACAAEAPDALRFAVRLTPKATAQLGGLPESLRTLVSSRLEQLALRIASPSGPTLRGHLLGPRFHALYEVDNRGATITVLEVGLQ